MARILIADDDAGAREMLGRVCEYRGHDVETARDGPRALAAYRSFQPHVLIVDLAMPLGGGLQLVRDIREQMGDALCPIIVISGYTHTLVDAEREEFGAVAYLSKPVEVEDMIAAVDNALGTTPPDDEPDEKPPTSD